MAFLTPSATGERDNLKTFLMQQYAQLRSTAYGLTREQLTTAPAASELSIGCLLVHATEATRAWLLRATGKPETRVEHDMVQCQKIAEEHTPEEFLAEYDERVQWASELFDKIEDLSDPVPIPDAPWFPKDLAPWETRWVILHLIAELARHAGHADIIRETIDGKGAYELNARQDGELADGDEFKPY